MDARAWLRGLLDSTSGEQVATPRAVLEELLAPAAASERPALPAQDRFLTVQEVAARLGVAPRTVYKRAKAYSFRVPSDGRELRFSAQGLERYLAKRLTRKAS